MRTIDRILLAAVAAGLWAVVGTTLFAPKPLLAVDVDAKDVLGLGGFVRATVEQSCRVAIAGGTRLECAR